MRRLAIPLVVLVLVALAAVALWPRDSGATDPPLQRVPASIVAALSSGLPRPTDETFPVLVVRERNGTWVPSAGAEVWWRFASRNRTSFAPDKPLGQHDTPDAIADAKGIVHVPRRHSAVTILGRADELERREHWRLVAGKPEVAPLLALRAAPRLAVRTVDGNGDTVPHVGLYWASYYPNGEMMRGPTAVTDANGAFVIERFDSMIDVDAFASGIRYTCRCPLAIGPKAGDRLVPVPDWGESTEFVFEVVDHGFVDWTPPVPEGCAWPQWLASVDCRTQESSSTLITGVPKEFPWRIAVPLDAEISIRVGGSGGQGDSVVGPTRAGEVVATSALDDHFWIRGRVDVAVLGWTQGGWAARYSDPPIRIHGDGTFSMPIFRAEWVFNHQWWEEARGRPRPYPPVRVEFETDHHDLVATDLDIPENPPDLVDVGTVQPIQLAPTVQGAVMLDGRPAPADVELRIEARDGQGEWRWMAGNRSNQRGRFAFYFLDPGSTLRIVVDDDRIKPIGPVPVPVGKRTLDLELVRRGS